MFVTSVKMKSVTVECVHLEILVWAARIMTAGVAPAKVMVDAEQTGRRR